MSRIISIKDYVKMVEEYDCLDRIRVLKALGECVLICHRNSPIDGVTV